MEQCRTPSQQERQEQKIVLPPMDFAPGRGFFATMTLARPRFTEGKNDFFRCINGGFQEADEQPPLNTPERTRR